MRISTTPDGVVTHAGIDYHKKFSVVTLGDRAGKVVKAGLHLPNEKSSIKKFFADYPGIECAVESCRGYEWFVDYLKELGLVVHLSNPLRTKLMVQTRCKTDKVDSRSLMQLLAIGFLPTCYQPTPAERKLRERLRWRAWLVRQSTTLKLKVHAVLDKENRGLEIQRLFTAAGREFLCRVALSESRRALLDEHLNLLKIYEDSIHVEDNWVKRTAEGLPEGRLLLSIPGIGPLTSMMIIAELGCVERFRNASTVAAYVGLTPRIDSSAGKYRFGRISKEGPSLLRWVLDQAAWRAVSSSIEFRCHYNSVMKRCGKQAAIVSVARKLIQVAYRVLRDKQPYKAELVGKRS